MQNADGPRLIFKEEFDERTAFEVEQKGWCGIAAVRLPNGTETDVFFYDPVRLAQDLEADSKLGRAFVAERNMIVVPRVTLRFMEMAAVKLFGEGYFDRLLPSE